MVSDGAIMWAALGASKTPWLDRPDEPTLQPTTTTPTALPPRQRTALETVEPEAEAEAEGGDLPRFGSEPSPTEPSPTEPSPTELSEEERTKGLHLFAIIDKDRNKRLAPNSNPNPNPNSNPNPNPNPNPNLLPLM